MRESILAKKNQKPNPGLPLPTGWPTLTQLRLKSQHILEVLRYWDESESEFLVSVQLVPNRPKTVKQGRHPGPEVRKPGSLEVPFFSRHFLSPQSMCDNYLSYLPLGE